MQRRPAPFTDDAASLGNMHAASSSLFDVVLLAGGIGASLSPLTATTPKALVPLCNRPLAWFAVKPWVDAGVRHMYVCAPAMALSMLEVELTTYTEFRGCSFTFLKVNAVQQPDNMSTASGVSANSGTDGGSADALRAYYRYKQSLPPTHPQAAPRDCLAVSCDTVISGVNLWAFVRNFYDGFFTAAAAYYEPLAAHDAGDADPDCLSVEPPCPTSTPEALHMRVHQITPIGELGDGAASLTAGATARRLNLTYTTAFADAHVYLLRAWALEFLDFHRDLSSIRDDLMPMLAGRQLPRINTTEGLTMPSKKLDESQPLPIPTVLRESAHPAGTSSSLSLCRLNSVQHVNPPEWDELRVAVTVYRAAEGARIKRVKSKRAYHNFTKEMTAGLTNPATATAFASAFAPYLEYETTSTLAAANVDAAGAARIKYCGLLSCPPATAKIARCIIGKNVEIGTGCTLRNCVLLNGCRVRDGVEMVDCIVCPHADVAEDLSSTVVALINGEPVQEDLK